MVLTATVVAAALVVAVKVVEVLKRMCQGGPKGGWACSPERKAAAAAETAKSLETLFYKVGHEQ